MVSKYGIDSGYKSVPLPIVDFAIKAAEEANGDVRNSATQLLKTIKSRGGSEKLKEILETRSNLKNSIVKQLIWFISILLIMIPWIWEGQRR